MGFNSMYVCTNIFNKKYNINKINKILSLERIWPQPLHSLHYVKASPDNEVLMEEGSHTLVQVDPLSVF